LLVEGDPDIGRRKSRVSLGEDMTTEDESTATNNDLQATKAMVDKLVEQMASISQSILLLTQKLN